MDPETVPEGRVQATQFICVRKSDNRIVGMLQVRHYFNAYQGCYSEADFKQFASREDILLERDLPKMYEKNEL